MNSTLLDNRGFRGRLNNGEGIRGKRERLLWRTGCWVPEGTAVDDRDGNRPRKIGTGGVP